MASCPNHLSYWLVEVPMAAKSATSPPRTTSQKIVIRTTATMLMEPRTTPAVASPPPPSPERLIWLCAMRPLMTATIPPTSGHMNQEMMPKISETTEALLVGDLYMSTGVAYWLEG